MSNRVFRQGDILSPYLYFLVVEGLSHLILDVNNKGNLSGVSCSNGVSVSYLLFADYNSFFVKWMNRN